MRRFNFWVTTSLFAVLVFTGCTKKASDASSSLTIKIPNVTSTASGKSTGVSQSAGGNQWNSSLIPTTFSEIDCFGIAVTGPEQPMQRNTCFKIDGTAQVKVGVIVATVGRGQTITMDVPSGGDRTVRVFGMKSNIACPNLMGNNSGSSQAQMSKPYILGQATNVNMPPGGSVNVSIPVASTLDQNNYFEKCEGPDFHSDGGGNGAAAASAVVKLQNNLSTLNAGSCVAAKIELLDAAGNVTSPSGTTVLNLTGTNGTTFYDANAGGYDCSSGQIMSTIDVIGGGSPKWLFVKAPGAVEPTVTVTASSSSIQGIPTTFATQAAAGPVKATLFDFFDFATFGTNPAQPYMCRVGMFQVVDSAGLPTPVSSIASMSVGGTPGGVFSFYGSGNCTNPMSTPPFSFPADQGNKMLSYRLTNTSPGTLELTNTAILTDVWSMGYTPVVASSPARLDMRMDGPGMGSWPNPSISVGQCYAVTVQATDAAGAFTTFGTSGSLNFTYDIGSATGGFYTDPACTAGPNPTATPGISGGSYISNTVFFKILSGSGQNYQINVGVSPGSLAPAVFPQVPGSITP